MNNSEQQQRWVATALLQIEPKLRTVSGYQHLPQLRTAIGAVGRKAQTERGTKNCGVTAMTGISTKKKIDSPNQVLLLGLRSFVNV